MAKQISFESVRDEYRELWSSMEIRASKAADINATAGKILEKKTRYKAVEEATGVPWFVVGAIHAMECGLKFDRHLHCGDPLTARTVHVPKGRPKAPPADGVRYSWQESALDALMMKGLEKITDWTIERICYELERYNGWGYRQWHADVLSPYLWSGTTHYSRGKYVADGKWSSTAVSGQSGAMALIKRLSELDPEVAAALEGAPIAGNTEAEAKVDDPANEFRKAEESAGFLSDRNFAKINDLADKGSRVAGWIRSVKRWFWGASTVTTGGAMALANTEKGSAGVLKTMIAEHPLLFAAGAGILIALVVYVGIKAVEKYIVTAHRDGRYSPRGG